jgi:hypothetical protein
MLFRNAWLVVCLAVGNCVIQTATSQEVVAPGLVPNRVLDLPPIPSVFINPGLTGIYEQLRAEAAADKSEGLVAPFVVRTGSTVHNVQRYVRYTSPETPPDRIKFNTQQIVVKFVEGSAIRLGDGVLLVSKSRDEQDAVRLARSGLSPKNVTSNLDNFNLILKKASALVGRAAPRIDESDLLRLRRKAESNTKAELPDLNLFYFIYLRKALPAEQALAFLNELRKSKIVEVAYFQPIPFDASDIPPITTIDVTNSEGYFMPAPLGVDVNYARFFPGGRGNTVNIADIESGWDTEHEDLPQMSFGFGTNWGSEHGTAVLGEIAAVENGYGATGIAPNAQIGWSSTTDFDPFLTGGSLYFYSVSNALLMSARALQTGDIALIEQQFSGPATGPCTCFCGEFGDVAVETSPWEHAAISALTGAGIVVVEAAGNGQTAVIPASARDSGAIIVGASDSGGTGTAACFTNFGPRVNVRAWGDSIGSTGFGDDASLRANGNDNRQWYTRTFNGTSGATPIVAGVAAIIQSTRTAVGLPKLNSVQMRTLLVSTGVPQSSGVAIGPQPNLRAAIASYIPDRAMFVSQTAAPVTVSPGSMFDITVTFQNTGGFTWPGDHNIAISPGSGPTVWQPVSLPVGSPTNPVMPGSSVMETFSLGVPLAPGTYRFAFALKNSTGQELAVSPTQTIVVAGPGATFDNAVITVSAPSELVNGATYLAIAAVTNTGNTTWDSGYSLGVNRIGRISLPRNTVPISGTVLPGHSTTVAFAITCNGTGPGGFSVQMSGTSVAFGPSVGQTVACQ